MNARDRERITNAVDFWITTKLGQQELSEATGRAQGGARAEQSRVEDIWPV